jgi:hypothetical protein
MRKWVAAGVIAIIVAIGVVFLVRSNAQQGEKVEPEARVIAYLKENIKPGEPVLVTELYNNVFTTPEDREALQRLYNSFLKIPASAAQMYMKTGKIPTLKELSDQFQFKVPGTIEVLFRVMEYDPRMPRFFERDPNTGEITRIYTDRIAADERFGRPLRAQ